MGRLLIGCTLALAIGACVFVLATDTASAGPLWVVHFHGGVNDRLLESYDDVVRESPEGVRVVVAVSNARDETLIRTRYLGSDDVRVLRVRGALSPWARDRYVLFERAGRRICLTLPSGAVPRHHHGDIEVPSRMLELDASLQVIRTPYAPIGGDTLVTRRAVIVGPESLSEIAARVREPEAAIRKRLEDIFARPLIVVGDRELPAPHIDLFLADAGEDRILVTDPRLLKVPSDLEMERYGPASLFDLAYNRQAALALDRIAQRLRESGFQVERIPGLFAARPLQGQTLPTVLTYTNVILHRTRVFIPNYGVATLDRAAEATWERLGYEVVPIRASIAALNGGAVRCIINAFANE